MDKQFDGPGFDLARNMRDKVCEILRVVYGAEEIFSKDIAQLGHSLFIEPRFFAYGPDNDLVANGVSLSHMKTKSHICTVANFGILPTPSASFGLFSIFPDRLATYCVQSIDNVMRMTGESRDDAMERFLFSLACHEVRHEVQSRNPGLMVRSLDTFFQDKKLAEGFNEPYMRMVWRGRSLMIDLAGYSEETCSLEQRKRLEEDSLIAEAMGFVFYNLLTDGGAQGNAYLKEIMKAQVPA